MPSRTPTVYSIKIGKLSRMIYDNTSNHKMVHLARNNESRLEHPLRRVTDHYNSVCWIANPTQRTTTGISSATGHFCHHTFNQFIVEKYLTVSRFFHAYFSLPKSLINRHPVVFLFPLYQENCSRHICTTMNYLFQHRSP